MPLPHRRLTARATPPDRFGHRLTLALISCLGAVLSSGVSGADPAPISPLTAEILRLEIDEATIDVEIDRAGPSSYNVLGDAEKAPALLLTAQDGVQTLRRAAPPAEGGDRGAHRLRLEVRISPEQSLTIAGRGLILDLKDPLLAEDEASLEEDDEDFSPPGDGGEDGAPVRTAAPADIAEDEDGGPAAEAGDGEEVTEEGADEDGDGSAPDQPAWTPGYGVLALRLETSSLTAHGPRNLDLELTESEAVLIATAGPMVATLNASKLSAEDHRGPIDVLGTDGETRLDRHVGPLVADLLGGSLICIDGLGHGELKGRETAIRIDQRQGQLNFTGDSSSLDLRGLSQSPLTIAGDDLTTILRDSRLLMRNHQIRGSLEVVGGRGQVQLRNAASLTASIEGFEGNILGDLSDGDLTVRAPRSRLSLEVVGGHLLLEGLRQLELSGGGSRLEARDISSIRRFELSDSQVELDLTTLAGRATTLALSGDSSARVEMGSPCVVKLGGRRAEEDRVDVNGCDLRTVDQTLRSAGELRRFGRRPNELTLMLLGAPEVEVRGR